MQNVFKLCNDFFSEMLEKLHNVQKIDNRWVIRLIELYIKQLRYDHTFKYRGNSSIMKDPQESQLKEWISQRLKKVRLFSNISRAILNNTLCSKRDFRDRVKWRVLSWEDDFGLSRWARANQEPLKVKEGKKRESEGSRETKALRLVLRAGRKAPGGEEGPSEPSGIPEQTATKDTGDLRPMPTQTRSCQGCRERGDGRSRALLQNLGVLAGEPHCLIYGSANK